MAYDSKAYPPPAYYGPGGSDPSHSSGAAAPPPPYQPAPPYPYPAATSQHAYPQPPQGGLNPQPTIFYPHPQAGFPANSYPACSSPVVIEETTVAFGRGRGLRRGLGLGRGGLRRGGAVCTHTVMTDTGSGQQFVVNEKVNRTGRRSRTVIQEVGVPGRTVVKVTPRKCVVKQRLF